MVSEKQPEVVPPGWTEHVNVKNGRTEKVVLKLDESPQWLPQGWILETRRKGGSMHGSVYKVYIEKSTGCKLYSKPQVLRYLEKVHLERSTGKEDNKVDESSSVKLYMPEQCESVDRSRIYGEKNSPGKTFLEEKEKKNELDELPHGWIKEYRNRKYKGGTKKDPYYTDLVSGYEFRSKKDVWRYLESGDIAKCASKPQKRDINQLKLGAVLNSPSPTNVKKIEQPASVGQLPAAGRPENESERLKEEEADGVPAVDVEERLWRSEAVECNKSVENNMARGEGFRQDLKVVDDNEVISPTQTANLPDQAQIGSRKSKRKLPTGPPRSSKRLAGHGPDMSPYSGLTERALRAALREEANRSSCLSLKVAASGVTQQLDTDLEMAHECCTSTYPEALLDANAQIAITPGGGNSLSNKTATSELPQQVDSNSYTEALLDANLQATIVPRDRSSFSNIPVASEVPQPHVTDLNAVITNETSVSSHSRPEMDLNSKLESCLQDTDAQQQTVGPVNAMQKELDLNLQGDYWSDPCFDIAFKRLMGEMPIEETLELDSCFQEHAEPGFGLPDMNAPAFFQNDETYNLGGATDQLPANPASHPVTDSLSGYNGFGSQPPSL